jgi:DNA helicase-2/ATP-dependent DNA helicase PcrA
MSGAKELHVYGPPGVGKTTYAAKQVQRAAETLGPDAVMVASFTKTAAAEIGSRGLGLGEKQVGTLHSFAYRAIGGASVVEDYKGLKTWNAQQWRDDRRLSLGGNRGDDLEFAGESGKTEGDRLRSRYNLLRNRMTPRELWEGDVLGFARDWEDYKEQVRGIDYTDMIEIALREGLLPGSYAAAFVDEAQDLSRLELSYVRFLGAGMDYFTLLGDPNQTLYHFKGATPNAFLDAHLPKENVRVLGQSHRVPRAVHKRAAA